MIKYSYLLFIFIVGYFSDCYKYRNPSLPILTIERLLNCNDKIVINFVWSVFNIF